MSRHNHLLVALFLGALLLVNRALADAAAPASPNASTNPPPAFNAQVRGGETIGDHQVKRAFLTIGTNEIAFRVPEGFYMDASNPGKIVLTDPNNDYFITVRIMSTSTPSDGSQADYFRGLALNRFPQAKISSQSTEFAANHSGPSFDMDWIASSGSTQSARIAFVPCPSGVLEFSVLSRTVNFRTAQTYLSVLMSSVRSNETGKLVIKPEPDYS